MAAAMPLPSDVISGGRMHGMLRVRRSLLWGARGGACSERVAVRLERRQRMLVDADCVDRMLPRCGVMADRHLVALSRLRTRVGLRLHRILVIVAQLGTARAVFSRSASLVLSGRCVKLLGLVLRAARVIGLGRRLVGYESERVHAACNRRGSESRQNNQGSDQQG
jgi:hypothetical protein